MLIQQKKITQTERLIKDDGQTPDEPEKFQVIYLKKNQIINNFGTKPLKVFQKLRSQTKLLVGRKK